MKIFELGTFLKGPNDLEVIFAWQLSSNAQDKVLGKVHFLAANFCEAFIYGRRDENGGFIF